ncbi:MULTISPECIES: DUF3017 domain-containing protein [Saccharopolyspora]|uniref:DUF3017 domain-containing protein n=1 Tax=Saccharopolyspora cebuensis TaxID=418759 RepID=A0ABV4CFP7_9PSEU
MHDRFGDRSRFSEHVAFGLVVLVALIAFVLIALQHWRRGATLLGGALVLAAVFRAVLSPERAGLLAIRSRPVDLLLYGGLGTLIIIDAVTIVGGPFS